MFIIVLYTFSIFSEAQKTLNGKSLEGNPYSKIQLLDEKNIKIINSKIFLDEFIIFINNQYLEENKDNRIFFSIELYNNQVSEIITFYNKINFIKLD